MWVRKADTYRDISKFQEDIWKVLTIAEREKAPGDRLA